MMHVRISLALTALVACSLSTTTAAQPAQPAGLSTAPVDQAGWNGRKHRVTLPNGIDLAYLELGNPAGKPLLLLHGYTDSSRTWSLLAPYLARYRLIIPDQRGHGLSAAPDCCYGTTQMAEDARLLLDALKIERIAIVGEERWKSEALMFAAADLRSAPVQFFPPRAMAEARA